MNDYLPFEKPLFELLHQIDSLKGTTATQVDGVDLYAEIVRLEKRADEIRGKIYHKLTPWQITQVARHAQRPHTSYYLNQIFDEFFELKGDRLFAEDAAILGGIARFQGQSVVVIGHEKGRTLEERLVHNFGMPKPEGYRKALRLMKLAEQFSLPVITFIDTPGAYPGVDAEERGQSEAIASSIERMSSLKVPIISCVIGEGGSGGALAIGVCDYLIMLRYATYSVISPEGCAAILWKDASMSETAAEAMKITSKELSALGFVDAICEEPVGGAHAFPKETSKSLEKSIEIGLKQVQKIASKSSEALLKSRYERLKGYTNAK